MNSDSPLIEYLIIGAHTSIWIILLVLYAFGIPLNSLTNIDFAGIVAFLPFIYLIGMLADSLAFIPLNRFRQHIQNDVFSAGTKGEHGNSAKHVPDYRDEYIALHSNELYNAYEVRVKRVRVIGAAIFNWPLIGIGTFLMLGATFTLQSAFLLLVSVLLAALSALTWNELYRRAYKFRKNAIDFIRMEDLKDGNRP